MDAARLEFIGKRSIDAALAFDARESFEAFRNDAWLMRNKNEHVIEYFLGKGKFPQDWFNETDGGIVDASSTFDTRIGNRLDWREVAQAANQLLFRLPLAYWPARDGQPGSFYRG